MLGVSRRRLSIRYCLPDSSFLLSCSPETSSRVTLAALGIGFQPKLPTTENPQPTTNNPQPTIHNRQPITNYRRNKVCLEDNTEQSESNPGRSLGIINKEGTAVWKTVPTNYQQPTTDNQFNHTKFAAFITYSAFIISTFRYSLDFPNKLIIKHINKRKAK